MLVEEAEEAEEVEEVEEALSRFLSVSSSKQSVESS